MYNFIYGHNIELVCFALVIFGLISIKLWQRYIEADGLSKRLEEEEGGNK